MSGAYSHAAQVNSATSSANALRQTIPIPELARNHTGNQEAAKGRGGDIPVVPFGAILLFLMGHFGNADRGNSAMVHSDGTERGVYVASGLYLRCASGQHRGQCGLRGVRSRRPSLLD